MKKNIILTLTYSLIAILFLNNKLYSQPDIEWKKNFGGSDEEIINSCEQTADGGYILTGHTYSNDLDVSANYGEADTWIVKIDASGDLEWEKNYGGSGSEQGNTSIKQTDDGGYVFLTKSPSSDGDVSGNNGSSDYWVVKINADGDIVWEKNYGGSSSEFPYDIQLTSDGGFIVAGATFSDDGDVSTNNGSNDAWILKLASTGDLIWEKSYGSNLDNVVYSIKETSDGGYVAAGYTDVVGSGGMAWIIKLDDSGNLTWEKTFGGGGSEEANFIQQTSDEGFILTGFSFSDDGDVGGNNGSSDLWVLKLSSSGDLIWEKNLGGSEADSGSSIQELTDGYIVAGSSFSNDGDVGGNNGSLDAWLIKLDTNGDLVWEENYGGSGVDGAGSLRLTTDGGLVMSVLSTSTDNDFTENNGVVDYWVVKFESSTVGINNANFNPQVTVSPNPSNGNFRIAMEDFYHSFHIQIFDILGHTVYNNNSATRSTEIKNFPKGAYFLSISSGRFVSTKMLIID